MLALVDMLAYARGGMAKNSRWFNYLAPFFYGPRIVGNIDLGIEDESLSHIQLPLGKENWRSLNPQTQNGLLNQLAVLCAQSGGLCLAVDRRFRQELQGKTEEQFVFSGDIFRLILMAVLVERSLREHEVRRLIFITEPEPELEGFLDYFNRMDTPIMLQSLHPSKLEPFCWRMLHEKGAAVSCGALHPQEWRTDDLVISFYPGVKKMLQVSPKTAHFILDDASAGLAPELEYRAACAGLDGNFAVIAPLMEYYLLKDQMQVPQKKVLTDAKEWEKLIGCGEKSGLWSTFLDKGKDGFI